MEQSENVPRETSIPRSKECPICGGLEFETSLLLIDHSVSKEKFEIARCLGCGFKTTQPIPSDLNPYYDSDDYISHSKTKRGIINQLYHLAQRYNLGWKYRKVKKHAAGNVWLDYGSGAGDFLRFLRDHHIKVAGVEPHDPVREQCLKDGFNVMTPETYLDTSQPCDVITMWHVLEHVENLFDVIAKHKANLSDQGILAIAVPNPDSYDAHHYKQYWAAYDVPRHLWHFTEKDIRAVSAKAGFEFITTYGMVLDSYYISLLSEKYKNGNFAAAVINGLRSNISALFKRTPYSSQIYILRKTSSGAR